MLDVRNICKHVVDSIRRVLPTVHYTLPTLFLLFTFHLSPFTSLQAQPAGTHHRCWDIEVVPDRPEYPLLSTFYTPAPPAVDTGLLIIDMAREYLGTPYHYGGRTPKGFDCAGFALFLYRHFGHHLPGWSGAQAKLGTEVADTRRLRPGDLVFFGGRHQTKTVGHTGIVVETDTASGVFRFIHASTGAGVIISKSTEPYYKQRYLTARRILHSSEVAEMKRR